MLKVSIIIVIVSILVNPNITLVAKNSIGGVEGFLQEKLGDNYYRLLDFKSIFIFDKALVKLDMFKDSDLKLPSFSGSKEEILNSSISYLKGFNYDYKQNDPVEMVTSGVGNCQAMSIALKEILTRSGIDTGIILEEDHAYNLVHIGDKIYKVDISKNEIDLQEVN